MKRTYRYTPARRDGHIKAIPLRWSPRLGCWQNPAEIPFARYTTNETHATPEAAVLEGMAKTERKIQA